MRSSKSSPAGNSSICTASVANSWILASGGVPARPQVDEDVAAVTKGAEPCPRRRRTTDNTFRRSYRIRTRITDVAAPDVVGPAGHGRGAAFRGGQPGRFVGSRGRGGPSGLLRMNGLHRGCARGAGQRTGFAAVLPLGAQARDPTIVGSGRTRTRVGDPVHMTAANPQLAQ